MLDRLKDVSSFLIIPTLILYFFGFVCITSYLAQFDIISFDVINARYLIAGFFPLIGLSISAFIAVYTNSLIESFYVNYETGWLPGYKQRLYIYFMFMFGVSDGSIILKFMINLTDYEPSTRKPLWHFSSVGKFDVIGRSIERMQLRFGESIDFIVKATIEVAGYAVLIAVIIWIGRLCRKTMRLSAAPPVVSDEIAAGILKKRPEMAIYWKLFIILIDVIYLSLVVVLLFWSANVFQHYKFGLDSLSDWPSLPWALIFAWIYSAAFTMLGFITWWPIKRNGQTLGNVLQLLKQPLVAPEMLYRIIVPLLLALFAFGTTIFPRIPFSLGGGAPRQVTLKSKTQPLIFDGQEFYLIGESDQFIFVAQNGPGQSRALQVNKNTVSYIEFQRHNSKQEAR